MADIRAKTDMELKSLSNAASLAPFPVVRCLPKDSKLESLEIEATAAEALHREALCVRIQPNKLQ